MIPFFRPNMGEAEKAAAINCIERGWLTYGPKMREFEAELAKRVQAEHVVALNSNTAGLHLVLLTLNLKPEDEVIVPAITFVATAETVRAVGAKVVLCDVDFDTRNMTLETVKAVATPQTTALMGDFHPKIKLTTGMYLVMFTQTSEVMYMNEDQMCDSIETGAKLVWSDK